MAVYKLSSSHFKAVNRSEFIGDENRIFYDENFDFYYSDGVTPGGIPLNLGGSDLSGYYSKVEVNALIADLIGGAPDALNTLNELANAIPDLHIVATSGSYDDLSNTPDLSVYQLTANAFSGSYNDLTDTPVLFDGQYSSLSGTPVIPSDVSQLTDTTNLLVHFSGSYNDLTSKPDLSVYQLTANAFSGSYNDLTDAPVIPSDVNELSDASGLFWTTDQNAALNTTGNPTFNTITLTNGAVIKDNVGEAVAFGQGAGTTSQGNRAVAIGLSAGSDTQQLDAIAIGYEAGKTSQGNNSVAIGANSATTAQGSQATAVGTVAGELSQGADAVAVGSLAGRDRQGSAAVAVGNQAGDETQGNAAVAVGPGSGYLAQGTLAIAIGADAAQQNQSTRAIAVGFEAGKLNQGADGIAIGHLAGSSGQLGEGIAIGKRAGQTSQGGVTVAIGYEAGQTSQGTWAVAIGPEAGKTSQGQYAVAIGDFSGRNTQGTNAVAVGPSAGYNTQGADAVAIGFSAGTQNQGAGAIAIGYEAGKSNQAANSIVINATGLALENTTTSSFVVKPVRELVGTTVLMYNATSGEITYSDSIITNAFSGSYNDLTDAPVIPSDVSQLTDTTNLLVHFSGSYNDLTDTPVLFDGQYSSLTGTPVIPSDLNSLTDVTLTTPISGQVLKYDGAQWVNATDGGGGIELTNLSVTDAGGDGSLSYNDTTGVFTYTGPGATEVRAHFSSGTGVTITDGVIAIGQPVGTTDNVTFGDITGTVDGFKLGYRNIPQVLFTASTTLAASDSGKHYYSTSATPLTLTIPTDAEAFVIGDAVNIINLGSAAITLAPAGGVTMYMAGNPTPGSRVISAYGAGTIQKVAANTWFLVGVGIE